MERGLRGVIAAGNRHTVGLRTDGTAVATGRSKEGQCAVSSWGGLTAVSAGALVTAGLCLDGSAVAAGMFGARQASNLAAVASWRDLVEISAGSFYVAGLRTDGSVVANGDNDFGESSIESWQGLATISAGNGYTLGLRLDGSVVAAPNWCADPGSITPFLSDLSSWHDLVSISVGGYHAVALRRDRRAVAYASNKYGQGDISGWDDLVDISAGGHHTVGLRSDGTVVAAGDNEHGQCDVSSWSDVVAVSAGGAHTVGVRSDGSVVAVGSNEDGQCNVTSWLLATSSSLGRRAVGYDDATSRGAPEMAAGMDRPRPGRLGTITVARFGPSTGWMGKTITFEAGQFILEDYGPIQAAHVLNYDDDGHLEWAVGELRSWVRWAAESRDVAGNLQSRLGDTMYSAGMDALANHEEDKARRTLKEALNCGLSEKQSVLAIMELANLAFASDGDEAIELWEQALAVDRSSERPVLYEHRNALDCLDAHYALAAMKDIEAIDDAVELLPILANLEDKISLCNYMPTNPLIFSQEILAPYSVRMGRAAGNESLAEAGFAMLRAVIASKEDGLFGEQGDRVREWAREELAQLQRDEGA